MPLDLGVGFLLFIVGLCALHFVFGYALADRRRKVQSAAQPGVATPAEAIPSAEALKLQAAFDELVQQVLQVNGLTVSLAAPLPDACKLAIADLNKAARTLATYRRSQKANPANEALAGFDFTSEELASLAFEERFPSEADDLQGVRREYPTWQYLAPYEGQLLPAPPQFRPVLCHDISVGGISFVCEEFPQQQQRLVITVGKGPNWWFLEARVVHCRSLEAQGKQGYLVGCRFAQHLGDHWELWPDGSFGRIHQNEFDEVLAAHSNR